LQFHISFADGDATSRGIGRGDLPFAESKGSQKIHLLG